MLKKINHTQISNDFIDNWMSKVSPIATKCFLAICRKTIGWGKEVDYISITQLMEITGLSNHSVIKAINELEELGLVTKEASRACNRYTVNYIHSEQNTQDSEQISLEVVNNIHSGSEQNSHTKETIKKKIKETNIKEIQKEKNPYGEFQNVFLTDDEYEKHKYKYGLDRLNLAIEKLSSWKYDKSQTSKAKKYDPLSGSDYSKMITWVFNAVDRDVGTGRNKQTGVSATNRRLTGEQYEEGW